MRCKGMDSASPLRAPPVGEAAINQLHIHTSTMVATPTLDLLHYTNTLHHSTLLHTAMEDLRHCRHNTFRAAINSCRCICKCQCNKLRII